VSPLATYVVTGGIDLATVKEILRHATIQMTMQYAHPTPENKRYAAEVLSGLFWNPSNRDQHVGQRISEFTA
jgi:integrase